MQGVRNVGFYETDQFMAHRAYKRIHKWTSRVKPHITYVLHTFMANFMLICKLLNFYIQEHNILITSQFKNLTYTMFT